MENLHHHYVRINGIRMHYVQAGSGPLLLLLHGFPEFWYSWRHQLSALSAHFTVVAPDLRGYNETDKPFFLWDYHVNVLMTDVLDLLHALGYERATVVGHDWGGMLGWYLGIFYPNRLERLVVMNAPHPVLFADAIHSNPLQWFRSSYIAFFQVPLLPEMVLGANNFALLEQMFRGETVREEAFSDDDIRAYKQALSTPGALQAALNWYRAYVGLGGNMPTFFGPRKEVEVPTLLIWGERDPYLGIELSYNTERFVPDLRVSYLPCSHWVQQECPGQVNQEVLAFALGNATTTPQK